MLKTVKCDTSEMFFIYFVNERNVMSCYLVNVWYTSKMFDTLHKCLNIAELSDRRLSP